MTLFWTLSGERVISLPTRMIVAIVAGGLTVLTLPPFSILLLVPVAYAALLVLLRHLSPAKAALVGWAFGLGQFGFGLSWIAESFYVDAERFGALAIPAVAGLSAGLAIFPAMAATLFTAIARRRAIEGVMGCLLFATCWTAAEWLRGHILTGFPWNLAGYALVEYAALRQPAAWVGSYGLSFLVILVGTLPAPALLTEVRPRWSIPLLGVGTVVAWTCRVFVPPDPGSRISSAGWSRPIRP
ncbi:hypothetical protein [Pseudooceanicola marinus]|jgi:apolipoprotein N-acyltransferase|uniref:hypothetical protein n=1 Tax=Pseudooceanicola marinus TaxID=396013 RepID=UPI001CD48A80|nr:hypothetical protein [Pseudooceanicola marinus]